MSICVSGHVYMCKRSCLYVWAVMSICVSDYVYMCKRSCLYVWAVMSICVSGHVYMCERSCLYVWEVMSICVSGIVFASISTIFLLELRTGIFSFSSFYYLYEKDNLQCFMRCCSWCSARKYNFLILSFYF